MPAVRFRRSRTVQLAEEIRQCILKKQLVDGDLFMTEAQLAEEFGASRTMIREAVSQLRELGILEGRKSKGLLVRRPDPVDLLSRSLPSLVNSEQDISELAELRFVLEIGAIELAVERGTAEQIGRLDDLAKQFELALQNGEGVKRENELEVAFHSCLLEMSGTKLVSGMQRLLVRFFTQVNVKPSTVEADQMAIWEHHALVSALRERDLELARSIIRRHLKVYTRNKAVAGGNDEEIPKDTTSNPAK